jgi:hypothetical protein
MDMDLKKDFMDHWNHYFNDAELPIVFFFSEKPSPGTFVSPAKGFICFIAQLARVRKGITLSFDAQAVGCPGGRRYAGFSQELRPGFEYFLSCGVPDEMEGERYKKTPELVLQVMKKWPQMHAPAKYIVFKRWDQLEPSDEPEVAIFFAQPDVLAGLFTLANFDRSDSDGVICPMSSGCAAVIQNPYLEKDRESPRAIIGMFDPSARPSIKSNQITFALPMNRLAAMVRDIPESFLTTYSWSTVQKRIVKEPN